MAIFFHIGYHKTGTTWLQEKILVQHPQIFFMGLSSTRGFEQHPWLYDFFYDDPLDFNETYFRDRFTQVETHAAKKVIGICNERLSGSMLKGKDAALHAERIKSVCPHAKIIISIRNQYTMVEAIYKQYVKEGGWCTVGQFLDEAMRKDSYFFSLHHLRYHRLIDYYANLFGGHNVCVLAFEDLCEDPARYLEKYFTFLNVDSGLVGTLQGKTARINQSLPVSSIALLRILNRFLKSGWNPFYPSWWPSQSRRVVKTVLAHGSRLIPNGRPLLSEKQRGGIHHLYSASNAALEKTYGLPLSGYGYPV